MRQFVTFVVLCLVALGARAQEELTFLGGAMRSDVPRANSFGLLFSYTHELEDFLSASFTYVNEGHIPSHHRDGHSAQIWARASVFSPQLFLAAGVGPYRYFDTTVAESPEGFRAAHGWGIHYSASATWYERSSPWFYQLRVDRITTRDNLDTTLVLAGVGYRVEQDGSFRRNATTNGFAERKHEVALLGGQTIVNSFESQNSTAKSLEYRHAFGPVLRGVIGWISEGDARLIRRDGVVAQAFLEPSFYRDRFTLGLGLGAYWAVDDYHPEEAGRSQLQGILTTTMSYHFSRGWVGRVSWHRIISDYSRDSDIILLGVGYRF